MKAFLSGLFSYSLTIASLEGMETLEIFAYCTVAVMNFANHN